MRCTACFRHYDIFCQHLTGTRPHQLQLVKDTFSSHTLAIYLPNRNFWVSQYDANQSQKSNPGYAQYCQAPGPSLDQSGPSPGQPGHQMANSSQGQPSPQPDITQKFPLQVRKLLKS